MSPRPQKQHAPLNYSFDGVLGAIADENRPELQEAGARPFLKWAGGKRSIVPELKRRFPKTYKEYHEPFVGGGALFFATKPEHAHLSDVNFNLILTYIAIRDDVLNLIQRLRVHAAKHDKDYYLRARTRIAREKDATEIGSLLIYLNKTCYNGLYRVNKKGEFNVPMGSYKDPAILDELNLLACSKALQGVDIQQHSFLQSPVGWKDFYYIDPPYHNTFSGYDGAGFGDQDHKNLAEFCKQLDKAGNYFMVSNSDTPLVRTLYKSFTIEQVMASRSVSCKANQRGRENELIIRNFE